jgi:L-asparaginase
VIRRVVTAGLLVLTLAGPPAAVAAPPVPRLVLITTGGTIANEAGGRLTPDQLLARVPGRARLGHIETEAFANTSSAALALDDWARLARHVDELLHRDAAPDGVVVTSGTDTLEELAWFLHLTVRGDRPVVVVGAMRRPMTSGEDGPQNLADACRVAASPAARGRGTLVVMHGQVQAARTVHKQHTTALTAFDEAHASAEGTVRAGAVRFRRPPAPLPQPGLLALAADAELPRVDILSTYQGADGDLLDAAVEAGAAGLVIASAGAGSVTPSQAEAARRLADDQVPVVIASRTGAGHVGVFDPSVPGIVSAGTLPPLKARLLLVLALARDVAVAELGPLFAEASGEGRRTGPVR